MTECLYFGKPMVLLPLFWDQYDNAQRIDETRFGIRLDTYRHTPEDLRSSLDRLLDEPGLNERLAAVSGRLAGRPGTRLAADLLERAT